MAQYEYGKSVEAKLPWGHISGFTENQMWRISCTPAHQCLILLYRQTQRKRRQSKCLRMSTYLYTDTLYIHMARGGGWGWWVQKRLLAYSHFNNLHIFQCIDKMFCVEMQRISLKFHTKYLPHTLKDRTFIPIWAFESSQIYELVFVSVTPH